MHGSDVLKEEDIVYGIKPTAFWSLNKEERTAVSRLVEGVGSLCLTYDVEYRNVADKHVLGTRKNLRRKVDLVLADLPYNVQGIVKMIMRSKMR